VTTEEDRAWIKLLVHEAVAEAMAAEREMVLTAIDTHTKGEDHAAFRAFIAAEARKTEMWQKIKTSVLGAVIIGVLFWVGDHFLDIVGWVWKTFGAK
jgi:hypothetical protein